MLEGLLIGIASYATVMIVLLWWRRRRNAMRKQHYDHAERDSIAKEKARARLLMNIFR